jgi:SAM-dependent methyltransferase
MSGSSPVIKTPTEPFMTTAGVAEDKYTGDHRGSSILIDTGVFRHRADKSEAKTEAWRPPLFAPAGGRLASVSAAVRRFFDLQAGSIWRDIAAVLPQARGTVLDVGCGAQPYRPLVSTQARYVGIDTSSAKDHFGYEMPDTRYFSGSTWPVDNGSVDFVLATETLEHVLDTNGFLAEAHRCLVPGGTFFITVPFAARWHFIPHDYWRFTPSSLKMLLQRAGFEQIAVYARGNAWTVACYKVIALLLRLVAPQSGSMPVRLCLQIVSILFIPLFVLLAITANISLNGRGGDDCLGFTAFATKV